MLSKENLDIVCCVDLQALATTIDDLNFDKDDAVYIRASNGNTYDNVYYFIYMSSVKRTIVLVNEART
jgi:hypothetical protein